MHKYHKLSDLAAPSEKQFNFRRYVTIGNYFIVIALIAMACCIAMSFFFEQHFSLFSQVAAHIGTIVFAGVGKVGYVIRCVGAHGLGYKVF